MKSKKLTKWKSIAVALVLLLGAAMYFIWSKEEAKKFQEKYGQFTYYSPEYKPKYAFLENGEAIAYSWEVVKSNDQQNIKPTNLIKSVTAVKHFENGVFINSYMKLKESPVSYNSENFNRNIPQKGEYWKLVVYQLKNQELEKNELDIFKMVRSYSKDLIPSEIKPYSIFVDIGTQKKYVKILLYNKISKEHKNYYVDLEKGKIVSVDEVTIQKGLGPNNFIYQTSFSDRLMNLGVSIYSKGIYFNDVYNEKNMGNTILAKEHPQIYKIMQGEDARIAFLNKETDVSLVKNVTELFFPPGTNVFESVTIPAKYSVDGQEHVINSAEELQKYYKEEEN